MSLIRILQFVFATNTVLHPLPICPFPLSLPFPVGFFGSSSHHRWKEKWQETERKDISGNLVHGSYVHLCRPHWCIFTWHIWVHHPVRFTISLTTPSVRACVCVKERKNASWRKGHCKNPPYFYFYQHVQEVLFPGIYLAHLKTPGNLCGAFPQHVWKTFKYSYDFYSIFQTIKTQSDAWRNEISDTTASYQSSGQKAVFPKSWINSKSSCSSRLSLTVKNETNHSDQSC